MKKLYYLLALAALVVAVCAVSASTQEVIYISDPTLTDTPKMLPRSDASLWNMDFRCNPALLRLDCPYEFIYDNYYFGGYHNKDTADLIGVVPPVGVAGVYTLGSVDSEYLLNVAGTDVGFAMRLNDRANLAFILNYRYGNVLGDGEFTNNWVNGTDYGDMSGTLNQRLDSHTVAPSVLFSFKVSDAFTLGASLKYAYTNERFDEDVEGDGPTAIGAPLAENLLIDRDLCLSYHYISPKFGISFVPSDRFVLNASVAVGFYFGGVNKDASLSDDYYGALFTPRPYTEDLHSTDVRGWDIAAKVRPEFKVSDALSIPLMVDFWYKDFRWGVDGTSAGYFTPVTYSGIFQGPGTIDYESDTTTWDITAGAGMKYKTDVGTLSGMLAYTHWAFNNDYDQENFVLLTAPGGGLTVFSQDDHETRDIMSLAFTLEKAFTDKFSADFGIRYDLGWACRQYDLYYDSPYEENIAPLVITTSGRDVYQDLTLSNHLTFAPVPRLKIVLGGFVTIPLDELNYSLDGHSTGLVDEVRRPWYVEGPAVRDYENCGWEWGGMLSLTYEFGCPVVVPPVIPAPVIEPKIEPMSKK